MRLNSECNKEKWKFNAKMRMRDYNWEITMKSCTVIGLLQKAGQGRTSEIRSGK